MTIDAVGLAYDALGRMVEQNRAGVYTHAAFCGFKGWESQLPPSPRRIHHASRYFSNFDLLFRLPVNSFNDLRSRTTFTGNTYHAFSGTT